MQNTEETFDLLPFAKQVHASLQKQQRVKSYIYENWVIEVFFGPVPTATEALPRIGHTACAQTQDIEAGPKPDVNASDGVRVDFDSKSVVWWSGSSLDDLIYKIEKAFPSITWDKED